MREFFIRAFVKPNFECAVNRLKMMRSSEGKGSPYQHQKLGIVCQVFDEWLAEWSTVLGIVTEDLFCIATGDVQETVVAECHSGRAIKTTGF